MATSNMQWKMERKYPRVDFRGRAVLFFGRDSEVSETVQVSEGGMMIYSKMRLNKTDSVTVHFTVNETYLRARCEVLYILSGEDDNRNRVGLKFVSLFQEYREAIRDLSN